MRGPSVSTRWLLSRPARPGRDDRAASDPPCRLDPILRLRGSQTTSDVGPTLVTDDNGGGGTTARLVYTNNGPTAFFTLELSTTTPGGLGAYTFTGSFDIPVYDLRADEGGFVSVLRTIGVGPGLLDGK